MTESGEKYTLEEIEAGDLEAWDVFVDASPDGTLFHQHRFLAAFGDQFRFFYVMKGRETHAGVSVSVDKADAGRLCFVPGVIHNGIIFRGGLIEGENPARLNSVRYDILDFVATELPRRFDAVRLRLPPSVVDVRPFQWFNYHSADSADKYRIGVRFTSFLDLSHYQAAESLEGDPAFRSLAYSRRQEIRYALRDGVTVERSTDVDAFLALYYEMSKDYDPDAAAFTGLIGEGYARLSACGAAELYLARNREGQVAAGALMGVDGKRAYYLYGASSKANRERYSGSLVLWEALRDLHQRRGAPEVDLEGINSPQRGYFKLSFGGDIRPYFELAWDRKASD